MTTATPADDRPVDAGGSRPANTRTGSHDRLGATLTADVVDVDRYDWEVGGPTHAVEARSVVVLAARRATATPGRRRSK